MKTISRYIMTLALLITAVTGAWAQEETLLTTIKATGTDSYSETTPGVVTVTHDNSDIYDEYGWVWWANPGSITVEAKEGYTITRCVFSQSSKTPVTVSSAPFKVDFIETADPLHPNQKKKFLCQGDWKLKMNGVSSIEVYGYVPAPATDPDAIDVTTNAAEEGATFTEATFAMPAFDATADYELVRDMQDEANPVAFSGLPTNDEPIVVKKGDDGKYQPAETLNLQLIDPLAAAEAQNIIAADGITVKVLVGAENGQGAIDFNDDETTMTLDAFLADMKPGYYWIKAESTDENSPYDGTVYSSQFTVVEKYDLTVKPANDFSKGKVESVTVGSGSVTIDANGKASKTGIDPDTEVKIKAKRGYVIDKVEVEKIVPAEGHDLTASAVGDIVGSDGKTYAAADKDNLPKNVTAVAMVAYKNGTGGLAIALSDEGSMNFSTAKSTCESKTAISGATWQLPSKNQWEQIFSANGGNNNSWTGLNTAIDNAGGTALVAGNVYWSTSSGPVSGSHYCMMINNDGSIGSQIGSSGKNKMTRAILTF